MGRVAAILAGFALVAAAILVSHRWSIVIGTGGGVVRLDGWTGAASICLLNPQDILHFQCSGPAELPDAPWLKYQKDSKAEEQRPTVPRR